MDIASGIPVDGPTIVGIDDSGPSRSALDWAVARAASRGRELILVRVIDTTVVAPDYLVSDATVEAVQKRLARAVEEIREAHPGLMVSSELVRGDPSTELGRFSTPSALLVVGTGIRTGPLARFEWSVGVRLATAAAGPVAIIPQGALTTVADVVAAVDGSEPGLVAARFAADEAVRHGGKLHLVHAWLEPPMPADYPPDHDFLSSLELIHGQILRRAVDEVAALHPRLAVTTELVHGPAASVVRSATAGRDLLVVGNHGLRDYSRQLLGLVSHAVVLNLAVPTIVVKHSA